MRAHLTPRLALISYRSSTSGDGAPDVRRRRHGLSRIIPSTETEVSGGVPTLPTYSLRVGILDGLEIGGRVANLTSLGADLKWNFLKSDSLDAAIDPGFQWFSISTSVESQNESASSSTSVFYFHAPILLGFNFSETVSLVASPGIAYGLVSTELTVTDERDAASTTDGFMARLGLGFDFRPSKRFAIHPQITFLRTFDDAAALIYMAGIGFNFGNLPAYGGGDPAAPPPKAND